MRCSDGTFDKVFPMTADFPKGNAGNARSRSIGAAAAVFALVLAGTVFLAVSLPMVLSWKISPWRSALPTAAMTGAKAESALLRAELLHEQDVRPRLILAGFGSEADLDGGDRYSHASSVDSPSAQLTACLWTARAFPALHDALLRMLLNTELPAAERAGRFYAMTGALNSLAEVLVTPRGRDRHRSGASFEESNLRWFGYYNNAPGLKPCRERDDEHGRDPQRTKEAARAERAAYTERLALANTVLPAILADMIRSADEKTANDKKAADPAARDGAGSRLHHSRDGIWKNRDVYEYQAADAMKTLWEKRADPAFLPLALEAIASGEGSAADRYAAIPLIAKKSGLPLAEYLFWSRHERDLGSITSCLGNNPSAFVYLIGCCDTLGEKTRAMLKEQGTLILDAKEGPGITLTENAAMHPAAGAGEKLYLLADMPSALADAPAYDLKRATPIFAGLLFRHMENQPLVLPLDPAAPDDDALIRWYTTNGWRKGRTLLFSAAASPTAAARHWGSLHLLWWSRDRSDSGRSKETGPALAFLHPESGSFMLGTLPLLKGRGAARVMGPVAALWFGVIDVDENGWRDRMFTARPEKGLAALAFSPASKLPAIMAAEPVAAALGDQHYRRYKIDLALWLEKKYPDPTATPLGIFSFVDSLCKELNDWKITRSSDMTRAAELFWRLRDDPDAGRILRSVLSQEKIAAHSRLDEARRAVGLPEENER